MGGRRAIESSKGMIHGANYCLLTRLPAVESLTRCVRQPSDVRVLARLSALTQPRRTPAPT